MVINSTNPLISRAKAAQTSAIEERLCLRLDQRIMKFVLFLFLTILILPIYFKGWPNVKRLLLEAFGKVYLVGLSLLYQGTNIDNEMMQECQLLKSNIKLLKSQIRDFDAFIKKNKELFQVCQAYLCRFPEYIIPVTEIPDNLNLNDPIDLRTKLLMEKNNLEHLIAERRRFIERHQEVYEFFQKSVDEQTRGK